MALNAQIDISFQSTDAIETHYDAFKFLRNLCADFGFERFLVAEFPELSERLSEQTILTNWDAELLQIYDEQQFVQRGSIWSSFETSSVPVSISFEAKSSHKLQLDNPEINVLKQFGMASATWIPVRSGSRRPFVVCLGSTRSDSLDHVTLAPLVYQLMQLGERLDQIRETTHRPAIMLSERETECVRWTAHGKTSLEIAAILALSEHTVNHYLAGAGRKLNAVSRPHAVANALRHGLIN